MSHPRVTYKLSREKLHAIVRDQHPELSIEQQEQWVEDRLKDHPGWDNEQSVRLLELTTVYDAQQQLFRRLEVLEASSSERHVDVLNAITTLINVLSQEIRKASQANDDRFNGVISPFLTGAFDKLETSIEMAQTAARTSTRDLGNIMKSIRDQSNSTNQLLNQLVVETLDSKMYFRSIILRVQYTLAISSGVTSLYLALRYFGYA